MEDKVMLITGASSGIGKACADHFHTRGWGVYGTSRSIQPKSHPYMVFSMDVRDDEAVQEGIRKIINLAGRIDAVINCAGYCLAGAIEDTSIAEIKAQFETNFYGTIRVCNAVFPYLRKQGSGYFVIIGSMAGIVAIPYQGIYSASKFALEGLSEALRLEVKPFGVHVVLIDPGNYRTKFTENRQCSISSAINPTYREIFRKSLSKIEEAEIQGADPDEIARLIERILSNPKPKLRYMVGFFPERFGTSIKKFLPDSIYEWLAIKVFGLSNN